MIGHIMISGFYISVSEYNSAMFNISYKLNLHGDNVIDEDMLEMCSYSNNI